MTAGWRTFPRAHQVATVLLGLFILPFALEALRGRNSNFVYIFQYLHTGPKPGHGLLGSLFYFLTFGGYDTFRPGHRRFEYQGWSAMWLSVEMHWEAYALWLLALLGAPAIFVAARQRVRTDGHTEQARARRKFLGWFYTVLAVSWGLTLFGISDRVDSWIFTTRTSTTRSSSGWLSGWLRR